MNSSLADMFVFATAYIDNIIIFSVQFNKHLQHLSAVLARLDEMILTLKAKKCQLAKEQCNFLEFQLRVQQLLAKVVPITNYSRPVKKKDMRAFLGLSNYYRQFMSGYGTMVAPLTDTTQKQAPDKINRTLEQEEAFTQIKPSLASQPVLITP